MSSRPAADKCYRLIYNRLIAEQNFCNNILITLWRRLPPHSSHAEEETKQMRSVTGVLRSTSHENIIADSCYSEIWEIKFPQILIQWESSNRTSLQHEDLHCTILFINFTYIWYYSMSKLTVNRPQRILVTCVASSFWIILHHLKTKQSTSWFRRVQVGGREIFLWTTNTWPTHATCSGRHDSAKIWCKCVSRQIKKVQSQSFSTGLWKVSSSRDASSKRAKRDGGIKSIRHF